MKKKKIYKLTVHNLNNKNGKESPKDEGTNHTQNSCNKFNTTDKPTKIAKNTMKFINI